MVKPIDPTWAMWEKRKMLILASNLFTSYADDIKKVTEVRYEQEPGLEFLTETFTVVTRVDRR